jgi:hypothetical protein
MIFTARALVIATGLGVLAAGCTAGQAGTASSARTRSPGAPGHGPAVATTPDGPYLVIERAAIAPTGVCQPGQPLLEVTAQVANRGTGASVAVIGLGMVSAMHAGRSWGNGDGLPALQPGQRATVTFPIYYLMDEPRAMPGRHTFQVRLNSGNWFPAETVQREAVPVDVALPDTCPVTTPAIAQ